MECRYFELFGPTSKAVRYPGLLSKAADKSSSVRVVASPLSTLTNISLMGVIGMSRQFFSTLVGMEFGSHDFVDEPPKSFLISSSGAHFKSLILDLIAVFLHCCNLVLYLQIWNE